MIKGMLLNNTYCVLDELSIIDNEDGFYSYHSEQWNLTSNGRKIGFVTIMERLPLVTRNGEKYELQCFTIPENEYSTQGYDRYSVQQNRTHLLKNAIKFITKN